MKTMNQKPELKEGQVCAAETVELNADEVLAVSGGGINWNWWNNGYWRQYWKWQKAGAAPRRWFNKDY